MTTRRNSLGINDDELPPSYDEVLRDEQIRLGTGSPSINSHTTGNTMANSNNLYSTNSNNSGSANPALPPRRQSVRPPAQPPRPNATTSYNEYHSTDSIYGNSNTSVNANGSTDGLPWAYPSGFRCSKCGNSGYIHKRSNKRCKDCWKDFGPGSAYAKIQASSNGDAASKLPWVYPRGFYCSKCANTGIKLKNGKSCKDCWKRFAPVSNSARPDATILLGNAHPGSYGAPYGAPYSAPIGAPYSRPSYGAPSPMGFSPGPGFRPPPGNGPGLVVQPGDPRLGGVLCGECRGKGRVSFFLDFKLCPLCNGVGRVKC